MKLTILLVSFLLSFSNASSMPSAPSIATKKEQKQIECIAKAVYFEARGTSLKSQAAVGQVIRNRVHDTENFPKTYCKVVFQKSQFSWTKIKHLKVTDEKSWDTAKQVATVTYYLGWSYSLVKDSKYFYSGKQPYWAKGMTKVTSIEGHHFLTQG